MSDATKFDHMWMIETGKYCCLECQITIMEEAMVEDRSVCCEMYLYDMFKKYGQRKVKEHTLLRVHKHRIHSSEDNSAEYVSQHT